MAMSALMHRTAEETARCASGDDDNVARRQPSLRDAAQELRLRPLRHTRVMSTATRSVTLADILAAQELLHGVSRVTPIEGSRLLSDRVGGPVHLKCENLQRAGSFKIRGAYVRLSKLTREERSRGVVAASAGNHAQGVALAASLV